MVDTMAEAKTGRKRTHSAALKAGVLAACAEPGVSVAAIALAHGLNTNLVHKWRRQAARAMAAVVRKPADTVPAACGSEFVALPLPSAMAEIRVEIRRGATTVELRWPLSAAGECASWLGTWLR
jgi:transposase